MNVAAYLTTAMMISAVCNVEKLQTSCFPEGLI